MKKLTLFLALFLISFTSAIHLVNTDYSLVVSSNNATECNFTYLQLPNQTTIFYNIDMTQNHNDFSLLIGAGNFTQTGETCMGITCTDGATEEVGSVCEDINSTTTSNNQSAILFLILILSALIFFIGGYLLDQDWLIFLSGILWMLTGVYVMIYGILNFTNLYTRTIAGVCLAAGIVLLVAGIFNISKSGGTFQE